jgi:hypothetical protein
VDQAEQFTEKELKLLDTTCRWPNTTERRASSVFFLTLSVLAPRSCGECFMYSNTTKGRGAKISHSSRRMVGTMSNGAVKPYGPMVCGCRSAS